MIKFAYSILIIVFYGRDINKQQIKYRHNKYKMTCNVNEIFLYIYIYVIRRAHAAVV